MSQTTYIEQHKDRFLHELFDLLRIPSISADSAFTGDVRKSAEAVADHLSKAGADNVSIEETAGHPIVYGEKIVNPSWPTVLIYGHYDVQPSAPDNLWITPAFEPTVRDGKIYARGAADDKGQFFMHVKACRFLPGFHVSRHQVFRSNVGTSAAFPSSSAICGMGALKRRQ